MSRKARAAWSEMMKSKREEVKPKQTEEKKEGPEPIKPVLLSSSELKGRTLYALLVSLAKNIKSEHMELSVKLMSDSGRLWVEIKEGREGHGDD